MAKSPGFWKKVKEGAKKVGTAIAGGVKKVGSAVKSASSGLLNGIDKITDGYGSKVIRGLGKVADVVSNFTQFIPGPVGAGLNVAANAIGLADNWVDWSKGNKNTSNPILSRAGDGVKNFSSKVLGGIDKVTDGYGTKILKGIGNAADVVSNFTEFIPGNAGAAANIASNVLGLADDWVEWNENNKSEMKPQLSTTLKAPSVKNVSDIRGTADTTGVTGQFNRNERIRPPTTSTSYANEQQTKRSIINEQNESTKYVDKNNIYNDMKTRYNSTGLFNVPYGGRTYDKPTVGNPQAPPALTSNYNYHKYGGSLRHSSGPSLPRGLQVSSRYAGKK